MCQFVACRNTKKVKIEDQLTDLIEVGTGKSRRLAKLLFDLIVEEKLINKRTNKAIERKHLKIID